VRDPDDPKLVIPIHKSIFRQQFSLPGYHNLKRVDTLSLQDCFNGGRGGIDDPYAPAGQDQVHMMSTTLLSGFLNIPVKGGMQGILFF